MAVQSAPGGCAAVRQACGEPVFGTAPERATAWLLVEQPGPWPSSGPPLGLAPEVVRVWKAAGDAGVRCQWIRPAQQRWSSTATVFAVGVRPGGVWVERRRLDDLRELAELDIATLAEGRPPGFGAATDQRIVLVCTHGKRDVCCARLGRPFAVRLDRRLPGIVWETTHLGGHRFAATTVTLPDGVYHGGLTTADTERFVSAVQDDRVVLDRLRGRAGLPAPVQAADYYARLRLGVHRLSGLVPLRHDRVGQDGTVRVELEMVGGARYDVYIRPRQLTEVVPTSCDGSSAAPTLFDLVGFDAVTARRGVRKLG